MPSPFLQVPGSLGARDELQQMVLERMKQQALEQAVKQQAIENTQKDRQISVSEANQKAMETDRSDRLAEVARNNKVSGALRTLPLLRSGQMVTPDTKDNFTEAGLGSFLQETIPQVASTQYQGTANAPGLRTGPAQTPVGDVGAVSQPGRAGGTMFTGTQADDQQAALLADRQNARAETLAATNERATADRDMKLMIAKLSASNSAESRNLANQLKELQIKAERDKQDAATTTRDNAARGVTDAAQETIRTIDELLDPKTGQLTPGASHIAGRWRTPENIATAPIIGGGKTSDAYAAFNRLKARTVVDLIAQMKSQSKTGATGFGALSEKEGEILAHAAAQLENSQSPEQFRDQLAHIRALTVKITETPGAPGQAAAPGAGGAAQPMTARNPQTGEVRYSDDGGATWHK